MWFTGISGAGKSTIAKLVEKKLWDMGKHSYLRDGDIIREGLCRDLGFDEKSRKENIRRVSEVAALMLDAGLIVIVAFISPFKSEREAARKLVSDGEFIEVFMDTPLHIAEQRDPKGLYLRAREGKIKNFTGIDSPYEAPDTPEITLTSGSESPQEMADKVLNKILSFQTIAFEI